MFSGRLAWLHSLMNWPKMPEVRAASDALQNSWSRHITYCLQVLQEQRRNSAPQGVQELSREFNLVRQDLKLYCYFHGEDRHTTARSLLFCAPCMFPASARRNLPGSGEALCLLMSATQILRQCIQSQANVRAHDDPPRPRQSKQESLTTA